MSKAYFIWCDESLKSGIYYSNFYGGVLVESKNIQLVNNKLQSVVDKIKITEEIKWGKVDAYKLPAFMELMNVFFDLVKKGKIKVRIMFRQTAHVAVGLTPNHSENEFLLLYYQFLKHSFGLPYSRVAPTNHVHLRLHFDNLPDTISKVQQFKEYIKGLERLKPFQDAKIKIRKEDIVEIDSKEHLPLQFLDVILGAMQFRLNNMHKLKPDGKKRRGKRTIAKEKLYKHINQKICTLRNRFNIGMTTGSKNKTDYWNHSYRHWNFKPKDFEVNQEHYK